MIMQFSEDPNFSCFVGLNIKGARFTSGNLRYANDGILSSKWLKEVNRALTHLHDKAGNHCQFEHKFQSFDHQFLLEFNLKFKSI